MLVLTQKCLKSPVNYLTLHLYPHKSSNKIEQTSCLLSAVGSASVSRNRADMREDYPNLQPRYVTWLGIKPPAFCCTGRHSNQLGHPARARTFIKLCNKNVVGGPASASAGQEQSLGKLGWRGAMPATSFGLFSLFFLPWVFLQRTVKHGSLGVNRLLCLISVEWFQVLKCLKTDWA